MVAPAGQLRRVDRYQLLELVGQGSFGGVYRARHVHTGQIVALKLALGAVDADAAGRILAEGRAAGRLDHPNIVGVLDGGIAETGEAFVVMQMLEGETLQRLLARQGPLETVRAIDFAVQMLDGLAAAHARGVIHRDVKPSNVFVTTSVAGGTPREILKVIDFGICKLHATGATTAGGQAIFTMPGVALGTPGYMAPEQLGDARSVDARADIYSVGATLFELLSGRKPIELDGLEAWMRRLTAEPAPPLSSVAPLVPPSIAAVVDRALARDRDARWPSATAMRDALLGAGASGGATTRPSAPNNVAPTVDMDEARQLRAVAVDQRTPSAAPPLAPLPHLQPPPPPPPPLHSPPPRLPRAPGRTRRSSSSGAWVFAMIGIIVAIVSIVALGLFVLLRLRG